MHSTFEEELKELDKAIKLANKAAKKKKGVHNVERRQLPGWLYRLRNFLGAANYDKERDEPASDEAHAVWFHIMDKPHWALPQIQYLIDERDEARSMLINFVDRYPEQNVATDEEI